MTRENMNDPTAAELADVLAFLMARIDDQVAGRPVANDDTASTEQDVAVDIDVLVRATGGELTIYNGRDGLELPDILRAGCAGVISTPDVIDVQVSVAALDGVIVARMAAV